MDVVDLGVEGVVAVKEAGRVATVEGDVEGEGGEAG